MELINKCNIVDIKKMFADKRYKYYNKGYYNLNIIGVRSNKSYTNNNNEFNDFIMIIYVNENNKEIRRIFKATVDPGNISLIKPINSKGCAILKLQQVKSMWKLGYHKGYEELEQVNPCYVYRDNNKDNKLDFNEDNIDFGIFKINLHHAGIDSIQIDNWSAGCCVLKRKNDFIDIMKLIKLAIPKHGMLFTFTLIDENDIDKYI